MTKIKLLICYHKKSYLFKDEILTPIHVGRANKSNLKSEDFKWLENNMIGDNTGINISDKNNLYNELTALYWSWKNYSELGNPDYIGLMHYRRHFVLRKNRFEPLIIDRINEKRYLKQLNYSVYKMKKLVKNMDFLPHLGRVHNVYKHYELNHKIEDLDCVISIILKKYPEYKTAVDDYLSGNISCFCNMCIFSKNLFFEYCKWIFDILEEFERKIDISDKRLFVSERLTGIFVHKLMLDKDLKYRALPISLLLEPDLIPIVLMVNEKTINDMAITICSILENSKKHNMIIIYIFTFEIIENKLKNLYSYFEDIYQNLKINFIIIDNESRFKVDYITKHIEHNKCIYISERTLSVSDIGTFFQNCSVDDFSLILNCKNKNKKVKDINLLEYDLAVLNCYKIRKGKSNDIGYVPNYFLSYDSNLMDTTLLFKERMNYQKKMKNSSFILFDSLSPMENFQSSYTVIWWNYYMRLPFNLQRKKINIDLLDKLLFPQQEKGKQAINPKEFKWRKDKESTLINSKNEDDYADWMLYGLFGKILFYYKNNGFLNTCYYIILKLIGRR